jgi:acyl-CoA synthetase (AMP-forming)/AMP-acid ligase II
VTDSDSTFVVAHDQEQVDKLLQIKDDLPLVKKVIYWDPKGLWNYDDPILISFPDLIQLGKEYEKNHPGLFEEYIENGKGEEIALICYTSGTTGLPKGAMISHRGLVIIGLITIGMSHLFLQGGLPSRQSVSQANWSQGWRSIFLKNQKPSKRISERSARLSSSSLPGYGKISIE